MAYNLKYNPLYKILLNKLKIYRQYIVDNLKKGFIKLNNTPWAAPILFIKKPNKSLQLYINYRKLNTIIKKNTYCYLLIKYYTIF